MANLTDDQFIEATGAVTRSLLDAFETLGLDRADAANVAGAAMSEIIARQIGPIGAIERLRDIADRYEQQVFAQAGLE